MASASSNASIESRPSPSPNRAATGCIVAGSTLSLSVSTINFAMSCSNKDNSDIDVLIQFIAAHYGDRMVHSASECPQQTTRPLTGETLLYGPGLTKNNPRSNLNLANAAW